MNNLKNTLVAISLIGSSQTLFAQAADTQGWDEKSAKIEDGIHKITNVYKFNEPRLIKGGDGVEYKVTGRRVTSAIDCSSLANAASEDIFILTDGTEKTFKSIPNSEIKSKLKPAEEKSRESFTKFCARLDEMIQKRTNPTASQPQQPNQSSKNNNCTQLLISNKSQASNICFGSDNIKFSSDAKIKNIGIGKIDSNAINNLQATSKYQCAYNEFDPKRNYYKELNDSDFEKVKIFSISCHQVGETAREHLLIIGTRDKKHSGFDYITDVSYKVDFQGKADYQIDMSSEITKAIIEKYGTNHTKEEKNNRILSIQWKFDKGISLLYAPTPFPDSFDAYLKSVKAEFPNNNGVFLGLSSKDFEAYGAGKIMEAFKNDSEKQRNEQKQQNTSFKPSL